MDDAGEYLRRGDEAVASLRRQLADVRGRRAGDRRPPETVDLMAIVDLIDAYLALRRRYTEA